MVAAVQTSGIHKQEKGNWLSGFDRSYTVVRKRSKVKCIYVVKDYKGTGDMETKVDGTKEFGYWC